MIRLRDGMCSGYLSIFRCSIIARRQISQVVRNKKTIVKPIVDHLNSLTDVIWTDSASWSIPAYSIYSIRR